MTVCIVGGYMRCMTSMMMCALEAGGMEAAYNENRNKLNERFSDGEYKVNEGGLYELSAQQMNQPTFPLQYQGKVVKVLSQGPCMFPPSSGDPYKVVFMRRDAEEIFESYEAAFSGPQRYVSLKFSSPASLNTMLERVLGILRQRRDMEVVEFWGPEVVTDPLRHFLELKERGWPVNPQKAAAVVDPELYRFRPQVLQAAV